MLEAAELGKNIAKGEQITAKQWRALSEAEKNAARAGWHHETMYGMGNKSAGPTTDFTQELRKPNVANELRTILPPGAGKSPQFPGGNREKPWRTRSTQVAHVRYRQQGAGQLDTSEKAVDAIDMAA